MHLFVRRFNETVCERACDAMRLRCDVCVCRNRHDEVCWKYYECDRVYRSIKVRQNCLHTKTPSRASRRRKKHTHTQRMSWMRVCAAHGDCTEWMNAFLGYNLNLTDIARCGVADVFSLEKLCPDDLRAAASVHIWLVRAECGEAMCGIPTCKRNTIVSEMLFCYGSGTWETGTVANATILNFWCFFFCRLKLDFIVISKQSKVIAAKPRPTLFYGPSNVFEWQRDLWFDVSDCMIHTHTHTRNRMRARS